jgi:hypothetical protein
MERNEPLSGANVSLTPKQLEALSRLAETDWLIMNHDIHPKVALRLHALGLVERRIFRPDDYSGGWGVPTCYRITEHGRQVLAAGAEIRRQREG